MKSFIKILCFLFKGLFKLSFFILKSLVLLIIHVVNGFEASRHDDAVMFSYGDDDTRDPANTTVTGKSYTPGQSIPMYRSH